MATREEIREGLSELLADLDTGAHYPEGINAIMHYLHSKGVVIKVDRELPTGKLILEDPYDGRGKHKETLHHEWLQIPSWALDIIKEAGYVATIPLEE